jgi:hypothetical protein
VSAVEWQYLYDNSDHVRAREQNSNRTQASGLLDAARWLRQRSIEDGKGEGDWMHDNM